MAPSPGSLLTLLLSPNQPQRTIHQCLALSRDGDLDQLRYTEDKLKNELTGSGLAIVVPRDLGGKSAHGRGSFASKPSAFHSETTEKLNELQERVQHARYVAICQEYGIEASAGVDEIKNAVDELIRSQSHKPDRSWGIGSDLVQKWVEQVETLEDQENLLREYCAARKKIALVLKRRFWRDASFRFLDLPPELRLPIYGSLLPPVIESAEDFECFLSTRQLRVRTDAVPALPTLRKKTDRSENENEMVLPLLLSCKFVKMEVESEIWKRFSKRKYEIAVDPEAIYWNGSCKWAFKDCAMIRSPFERIQRLHLSVYLRPGSESVDRVTTQMESLVSTLRNLKHLKELDVVLLPYPRWAPAPTSLPLDDLATAVSPLLMLKGIEHATISVNEGVDKLACPKDFHVKSWFPSMPFGNGYSTTGWILPNPASEQRWEEIQAEVVNDMRQPRETASVGLGNTDWIRIETAAFDHQYGRKIDVNRFRVTDPRCDSSSIFHGWGSPEYYIPRF